MNSNRCKSEMRRSAGESSHAPSQRISSQTLASSTSNVPQTMLSLAPPTRFRLAALPPRVFGILATDPLNSAWHCSAHRRTAANVTTGTLTILFPKHASRVHASSASLEATPSTSSDENLVAQTSATATVMNLATASSQQQQSDSVPTAETPHDQHQGDPEMQDLLKLVALLPETVGSKLEDLPQLRELMEVVMDLGRPPLARFPSGEIQLSEEVICIEDINYAVSQVGEFDGDNRAGIDATLHRISCIRNRGGKVIGLTCRAGRAISGSAALVEDLVRANKSILLLGRPGVGKTTAIRDMARMLADACRKRVVIVDTSNEIGGDGDIPHPGIGSARRMQVAHPEEQHKVMIEAVENHMPQVIIIDEISTMAECNAARTIAQRGVQLVATAHGQELENLVKNPSLQDLVGGIQTVTLGDESAKKRGTQKSILERAAPPTFDAAIEMTDRGRWTVHLDVASAVDEILLGGAPRGQTRERDSQGNVKAVQYVQRTYVSDNNLDNWGGNGSGLAGSVTYHKLREKSIGTREWVNSVPSPTPWVNSRGSSAYDDDLLPKPTRQSESAPEEIGAFVATSTLSMQRSTMSQQRSSPSPSLIPVAPIAPSTPLTASKDLTEEDRMKVFFVMDERGLERVRAVVRQLDTECRVQEVTDLEAADVLIASRKQLRNNTKIRNAAKKLQVPIYAVKASSPSGVMRDLCPLLGLEPCPVPASTSSSFGMDSMDEEEEDAADVGDDQSVAVSASSSSSAVASSSSSSGRAAPAAPATTCAEDWAALLASTVRELRYQPVDREFATRILASFLEELPDSSPAALATMTWALAYTKNKKRFLESSGGQLQMLADAVTPRLQEFKASELVQVATGFAALKYYPGDDFWDGLESCSQKYVDTMNEREVKAIRTSFQVLDSLRIMATVALKA